MKIRPDPCLFAWKGAGAALAATLPVVALGGPGVAAAAGAQTAPPPAAARGRTINLSFYSASVVDVMRAISLQSGVGIVVGPSAAEKRVTVRLLGVTIEEALRLVTDAAGMGFRRTGNTYLVGSPEEIKRAGTPETSATYLLKNISPQAARTLIEAALPFVTVQFAEGVPALVLSGSEADVREAERLLSQTDVATPAPPPVFEAITPRNISANALAGIVEKAAPEVTVTVQGNTVIISGPREAVDRVRTMAPTVDVPGGAGRRVEIYNIKYSSAQSLSVMLASAVPGLQVTPSAEPYAPPAPGFSPLTSTGSAGAGRGRLGGGSGGLGGVSGLGGGLGAGGGGATAPDASGGVVAFSTVKSRSLILSGRDTDVEEALRLLDALDIAPVQVEIEAHVVDLTLEDGFDFGIQWGGTTQSTTGTGTPTFNAGTTGPIGVPEQNVPGIIRFGRFTRGPINFAAQLRYLETRNRGKTLARPHISVIDNEDASIFIGQILRFQLESTGALGAQTVEVEEIPVGITLLVRPRVNGNDEITMKIKPVVSTVLPTVGGLPQTATREADSTLRVRDGETIVIGGLIQDQETKNMEQVPLLGKIPLFGELFRRRNNRRTRSEVLVFLTPHLLRDNGAAAAAETLSRYPDVKRVNPPTESGKETPKK